jgi:four helix bundle protein
MPFPKTMTAVNTNSEVRMCGYCHMEGIVTTLQRYNGRLAEGPDGGHRFETFEGLEAYQVAREFRKAMYAASRRLPDFEKFELASQIRRAAVSLTNNIAEGHGRYHYPDQIKFLLQSRGSLEELLDDLNVCLDEDYLSAEEIASLKQLGLRWVRAELQAAEAEVDAAVARPAHDLQFEQRRVELRGLLDVGHGQRRVVERLALRDAGGLRVRGRRRAGHERGQRRHQLPPRHLPRFEGPDQLFNRVIPHGRSLS